MINWSIWLDFWIWVFSNLDFLLKLYVQVNCWFLKCHWTLLNALEHASCVYTVHASFRLFFFFFCFILVWCSLPLGFLCFLSLIFFFYPFQILSIMVRKTRAHRTSTSTSTSTPTFDSERFRSKKHQENFEKLYIFRFIWAKRKVILDE